MRRVLAPAFVGVALLLGACGGGSDVVGTYTCPENTSLELREDGTFLGIDGEDRYTGTYEVEDQVVWFTGEGLNTVNGVLQEDGSLNFGPEGNCTKD